MTFLSIFSISEDAYVNVNSLYIKFLYNFFLPNVSSPAIPSVTFLSLVQSFDIIFAVDDEANKVHFVLIDTIGVLTQTLNSYCIIHNTLPFLSHLLYACNIFIYMHLCYHVITLMLDIHIEFEISYMM